jgi:hypothetical protein
MFNIERKAVLRAETSSVHDVLDKCDDPHFCPL